MKAELECTPDARAARPSQTRLRRFEELQSQEFQKRSETNEIHIPVAPGRQVIELHNVTRATATAC